MSCRRGDTCTFDFIDLQYELDRNYCIVVSKNWSATQRISVVRAPSRLWLMTSNLHWIHAYNACIEYALTHWRWQQRQHNFAQRWWWCGRLCWQRLDFSAVWRFVLNFHSLNENVHIVEHTAQHIASCLTTFGQKNLKILCLFYSFDFIFPFHIWLLF